MKLLRPLLVFLQRLFSSFGTVVVVVVVVVAAAVPLLEFEESKFWNGIRYDSWPARSRCVRILRRSVELIAIALIRHLVNTACSVRRVTVAIIRDGSG